MLDRKEIIKVVPGHKFENRAAKYLAPSLKLYGEEFITKLRSLATLAMGVQDFGFNKSKESRLIQNHIYILIDTKGRLKYNAYSDEVNDRINFSYVLQWIRDQSYYITDYPFDSGRSGHQHMIVLELPIHDSVANFMKGRYTKMYSPEVIMKIVDKNIINQRTGEQEYNTNYGVLTKDEEYSQIYVNKLNEFFNTNLETKDIRHHEEYDVPPMIRNEIFRFNTVDNELESI